jgi:TrmH family RNA methyltransferase
MNCRVVLVGTEVAANLGAIARVMCNFGLSDLVLVSPVADPRDLHARVLATRGEDVLDRCRVVDNLAAAVGDCVLVVGTSARTGGLFRKQSVGTPDAIMPRIVEATNSGPVALVFGPERTGLTNDDVNHCTYLIHIPTHSDAPALNLAQSVAICLYELRRAGEQLSSKAAEQSVAPVADRERMFTALRKSLERIDYLYGPKADALMFGLRHLIGRAQPSPMEIGLLTGLARQIEWFAANHTRAAESIDPSDDAGMRDVNSRERDPRDQSL